MISRTPTLIEGLRTLARSRFLIDYQATARAIDLSKESAYSAWRDVGAVGAPAFENDWDAPSFNIAWDPHPGELRNPLGFYRDNWGFIHFRGLTGNPVSQSLATIFTVPFDLIPSQPEFLYSHFRSFLPGVAAYVTETCILRVDVDGTVRVHEYWQPGFADVKWLSFDNLRYRAANAGKLV